MTQQRSRPNLASIAASAGVSVPTVSKVIHGRPGVSDDTRKRVQELIDATGYQSPSERRLRSTGPMMVDLVIGDSRDQYSMGVFNGIRSYASEADIDVVISSLDPKNLYRTDAEEWSRRMVESGRRGLIAVTSQLTRRQLAAFAARDLPVVVVDAVNTPDPDVVSVGSTNWAGGKAATEHLLAMGHERIAFLGGPTEAECNQARMHGYLAALMSQGIPMRPEYMLDGEQFARATGAAGARELFSLPEPPTAIFAAADSIALGVLSEARAHGLDIPRDLSLVGFDGVPLGEQTLPALTSVAQPLLDIGRTALRTLVRLTNGERLDSLRVELATELVVRGSTAAPRSGGAA